jgi:hypothetical protein
MRVGLIRRADLSLPPFLLMGIIFLFSAQPSLDSGLGVIDFVGRKLIHFAEYALLCFWNSSLAAKKAARRGSVPLRSRRHQSFVEVRGASAVDWAIYSSGAALVALRLRSRAPWELAS